MTDQYHLPAAELSEQIGLMQQIQSSQTKKGDLVLKTIYEAVRQEGAEPLTHKQLADEMGLSIHALSNIISRVESRQWKLMDVRFEGRYKYYSLTELGNRYVETCLLKQEQDRTGKVYLVSSAGEVYYRQADEALQAFKGRWGEEWADKLYEFLKNSSTSSVREAEEDAAGELTQITVAVRNLYLKNEEKFLQKIYDAMKNPMLVKAWKSYLSSMEAYRILCEMDQEDWLMTYRLIDRMFEVSCLVEWDGMLETFVGWRTRGQLNQVISGVSAILKAAKGGRVDKTQIFNRWKGLFPAHERLLFYIAEKCCGSAVYPSLGDNQSWFRQTGP